MASESEESNKGDSFSNSSLRRKLFNNDHDSSESGSTPSTPEKSLTSLEADFLQSPSLVSFLEYYLLFMGKFGTKQGILL